MYNIFNKYSLKNSLYISTAWKRNQLSYKSRVEETFQSNFVENYNLETFINLYFFISYLVFITLTSLWQ